VIDRLQIRLAALRAEKRCGLAPYVTAGDGGMDTTLAVLRGLDRAGVACVELGLPFSDPVADGPVLQAAAERAIAAGASFDRVLDLIARFRGESPRGQAPIVLMGYANPLLRRGWEGSCKALAEAGADGVLVADLPIEEGATLAAAAEKAGIAAIFFAAPTTADERLAAAVRLSRGFLYAIGRLGVTGARASVDPAQEGFLDRVRAAAGELPVAVGFGLSTAEQVRAVAAHADLAIVGSAMVDRIHRAFTASGGDSESAARAAEDFARELSKGLETS
jgi:tryptophan synthase alpha chain